jgi:hypothetical protein
MDMRQWITAAWRGTRLPRGRAHRLTQHAGWAVQGIPDGGSSDQQDDDGDHKLHPGKPMGFGVAGRCRLPGGLVRFRSAHWRGPI